MVVIGVGTGSMGADPFDPACDPVLHRKVPRAVLFQQNVQPPAARRGELQLLGRTARLCLALGPIDGQF